MRRNFIVLLLLSVVFLKANVLQEAIDKASPYDVLELSSGIYNGNITIDKPLTIDGIDKSAIVAGDKNGSVITIKSSNVTIKNLIIKDSGEIHANDDSGVKVDNSNNVNIENNTIKDVLFGITLLKSNNSSIKSNQISSYDRQMGFKGDAIKLWYSHSNKMLDNNISNARDAVFWYSSLNEIRGNYGKECRYSLHFMYSNNNIVENNTFEYNKVGMFFMFSRDVIVKNNIIRNSDGAYGVGIGMKDSSNFSVENNILVYNARGFYLDQSPYQPDTINFFRNNEVAYNSIGVQFHATTEKSIFEKNTFKGNMDVALNDTPESKLFKNEWIENYYDDYDGFDMDKNGFGDVAYQSYAYADKLWQHRPNVRFFYGSSGMMLLNFIAKLAPFSEPVLVLKDEKPRIKE